MITYNIVKIGITLCSLKCMGRLVIKLKAIEYNKDFFCYLSFYTPDFSF